MHVNWNSFNVELDHRYQYQKWIYSKRFLAVKLVNMANEVKALHSICIKMHWIANQMFQEASELRTAS